VFLMRRALGSLILAAGIVSCTQSEGPEAAALGANVPRPAVTPEAATALVPGFLGCYNLAIEGGKVYHIRLTDTRQGPTWLASSYGPGSRNAPGDQWSWTPADSTRFTLEWGGIDGAMTFTVESQASEYVVSGQIHQARGSTDLHPTVRRVGCPPPAA
jgi:hypothetical protein